VEQFSLVKQAKAHLAKLDGTTSKGTGSTKKSTKKPKATAAAASQAYSAMQAEYMSNIKQAQEAAEKANVSILVTSVFIHKNIFLNSPKGFGRSLSEISPLKTKKVLAKYICSTDTNF
jgi:hypothetical protein